MAFIFVCGTHTFTNPLKGYEHVTAQCQNCGNWSARCFTRWEWFTFCFVPVIPFSLRPWHEVGCHICSFWQDLKYRPDIQNLANQSNQVPMLPYGGGGTAPPGQPGPPYGGGGPPYGGPPGGPNTDHNKPRDPVYQ